MDSNFYFLIALIAAAVGIIITYFLIKISVKHAIKEANREINKPTS